MKKYNVVLFFLLLLVVMPLTTDIIKTSAETKDEFSYMLRSDGSVAITAYNGTATGVIIPDSIDGKTVTEIQNYAFDHAFQVTGIVIPETVNKIGQLALKGNGLQAIMVDYDNPNYTSQDGVLFNKDKTIVYGYPQAKPQQTYIIPDSVTEIWEYAFYQCTSLSDIDLNQVQLIESYAFGKCNSLSSVFIPKSVITLRSDSFYRCTSLFQVNVEMKNTSYYSENGVVYSTDKTSLIYYPSGKNDTTSYSLLAKTIKIEESAFAFNTYIKYIVMQDAVTSIGGSAFSHCENLQDVTISGNVSVLPYGLFMGCKGLTSITIPGTLTELKERVFYDCSGLTNITFENGVTSIGDFQFYNCSKLKSISIPDSVTTIGTNCFSECLALTDINVGAKNKNYSSIDGVLFTWDKTALLCYPSGKTLSSYDIPGGTLNLKSLSFYKVAVLQSIKIPNSVTNIEALAIIECKNIVGIVVDDENKSFCTKNGVLYRFDESSLIYYPTKKADTFYEVSKLTKNIESYAFGNCESLETVSLPDGLDRLSYRSFTGCKGLKQIIIPDSVEVIGDRAFYDCNNLLEVNIPKTVTTIGTYAFGYESDYENEGNPINNKIYMYCYDGSAGFEYAKTNSVSYDIIDDSLNNCKIMISDYIYNGQPANPVVLVKYGAINLVRDVDYQLEFKQQINVGSVDATITGIGKYSDVVQGTFKILPGDLSNASIELSVSSFIYNGTSQTPLVAVKLDGVMLVNDIDYSVSLENTVNVGTAAITITGKGNYLGLAKKSYDILAAPVNNNTTNSNTPDNTQTTVDQSISKPSKPVVKVKAGKKLAIIKWGKVKSASGYELMMSKKKSKSYSSVKKAKSSVTSYTKKGLTKGKTYYFKVRAYKIVKEKKVYSSYSSVKAVKIK